MHKTTFIQVVDALPLRLKLPCEITRFKLDQLGAGQAAADLSVVDVLATVGSGKAKLAQLGGGQVGYGGDLHGGSGFPLVSDDFAAGALEGFWATRIDAYEPVKATRLCLQKTIGQTLNLKLSSVGRELPPCADAALMTSQSDTGLHLRAVVIDYVRGLHGR